MEKTIQYKPEQAREMLEKREILYAHRLGIAMGLKDNMPELLQSSLNEYNLAMRSLEDTTDQTESRQPVGASI